MRKFLSSIFKKIALKLDNVEPPVTILEENKKVALEELKEVEQSPPQSKKVSTHTYRHRIRSFLKYLVLNVIVRKRCI